MIILPYLLDILNHEIFPYLLISCPIVIEILFAVRGMKKNSCRVNAVSVICQSIVLTQLLPCILIGNRKGISGISSRCRLTKTLLHLLKEDTRAGKASQIAP